MRFWIFTLIFLTGLTSKAFEPHYDQIKDFLLRADIDSVLQKLEKETPKLGQENSEYYSIALIADGRAKKVEEFIEIAIKRHPKSTKLKEIKTHIESFFVYQKQANRLLPYFDKELNYLLTLSEKQALDIIEANKKILFPKTLDFYKAAMAYRSLAILSIEKEDIKNATRFIKLGKENIFKMRSIWLDEDIIVENKLMKTRNRSTKFSYIFPQWIILLREEFNSYLSPSST